MVILASTAQSLMDQYNNNTITIEQFKTSMNSQVVPQVAGLDKTSHNDSAWHTISSAVALVGSPD
jgi:hypothetical protein